MMAKLFNEHDQYTDVGWKLHYKLVEFFSEFLKENEIHDRDLVQMETAIGNAFAEAKGQNLYAFIKAAQKSFAVNRAYVSFPGFSSLYVRVAKRYINGEYVNTIDLAAITAEKPSHGAFKNLIKYLNHAFPEYGIYVESVLTERFKEGLLKLGFTSVGINNFYFPALKDNKK